MNPTNSILLYLTTKKMDLHLIKLKLPIIALIICVSFHTVISDMAKDRQECTAALTGLATCLPYVQGTSKAPTPDCCSGLKQVLNTNKKCLCVIVIDGNSPDMGLGINVTLALGLPSVCSAPANVSQCPALLHLAPNSPEAQIFNQFGHASSSIAGSPAGSPVGSPFPSVGPSGSSTGKAKNSGGSGHYSGRRWKALKAISSGLLITLNILIWN